MNTMHCRADWEQALRQPLDPELHAVILARFRHLDAEGVIDMTDAVIVSADATEADLIEALGWTPLTVSMHIYILNPSLIAKGRASFSPRLDRHSAPERERCEVEAGEVVLWDAIVSCSDTSKLFEPADGTFDAILSLYLIGSNARLRSMQVRCGIMGRAPAASM